MSWKASLASADREPQQRAASDDPQSVVSRLRRLNSAARPSAAATVWNTIPQAAPHAAATPAGAPPNIPFTRMKSIRAPAPAERRMPRSRNDRNSSERTRASLRSHTRMERQGLVPSKQVYTQTVGPRSCRSELDRGDGDREPGSQPHCPGDNPRDQATITCRTRQATRGHSRSSHRTDRAFARSAQSSTDVRLPGDQPPGDIRLAPMLKSNLDHRGDGGHARLLRGGQRFAGAHALGDERRRACRRSLGDARCRQRLRERRLATLD